jgi:putative membrane protein
MNPALKSFLQRWVINTLAVLVATYIVHGIYYEKGLDLFVASLLLGILNAVLRPLLLLLSLPLLIFSFGFFLLVINALLLRLVSSLLKPHFYVDGFWPAFWGALVISIVSLCLNTFTGTGQSRIKIERKKPGPPPGDGGSGPVIDV